MFTHYIKYMRKTRGITQKDLAAQLYIAPCTLSHYESGKRILPYETLQKILDICEYKIKVYDCKTGNEITNDDVRKYLGE